MTVETLETLRRVRPQTPWRSRPPLGRLQPALPYLAPLAILALTLYLAWAVRHQQHRQIAAEVSVAAAGVTADLGAELEWHVQAFERMARRWEAWESPAAPGWQEDAELYLDHHDALTALARLTSEGEIAWQITREGAGGTGELADLLAGAPSEALERARRTRETVFAPPAGPVGAGRLVPLFVPLDDHDGGPPGSRGILVALLDSTGLLDQILADQLVLGYGVDLSLYGIPVFRAGASATEGGRSRWIESRTGELFGAPWALRVWPGATNLAGKRSWLPAGVLVAGLLLTAAFAATARFGRVARRHAAEVERARRELERSNAELEQFAYVASHDLQEPLRQVAGFVGLLERRYADRLDAEAREFIGYAVEGVQRMQRLINDLLTYSRVGARSSEPEDVDPAEPLARALVDLQQAVEESRAVITNEGPMPRVRVDVRQLALVFQNLLSNAIKYAGDAPPRVHVSASQRGAEVEIAVSDRGIGIDPRFFDRIFIVFQRLHTRDQFSGTGIGLAIVKRIVEQHGGRIWVTSSPGEGATFHFSLPAAGEDAP